MSSLLSSILNYFHFYLGGTSVAGAGAALMMQNNNVGNWISTLLDHHDPKEFFEFINVFFYYQGLNDRRPELDQLLASNESAKGFLLLLKILANKPNNHLQPQTIQYINQFIVDYSQYQNLNNKLEKWVNNLSDEELYNFYRNIESTRFYYNVSDEVPEMPERLSGLKTKKNRLEDGPIKNPKAVLATCGFGLIAAIILWFFN